VVVVLEEGGRVDEARLLVPVQRHVRPAAVSAGVGVGLRGDGASRLTGELQREQRAGLHSEVDLSSHGVVGGCGRSLALRIEQTDETMQQAVHSPAASIRCASLCQ